MMLTNINKIIKLTDVKNSRKFWAWLNVIFNRIQVERIQEVGPDRACAEWLIRNGAEVTFDGEAPSTDYNLIAAISSGVRKRLVGVNAVDAAITHHGFDHFKGCRHVRDIKFHKCSYISDEALRKLGHVRESLERLQVTSCDEVTDKGVQSLIQFRNLTELTLSDLRVKDWNASRNMLNAALPKCRMNIRES